MKYWMLPLALFSLTLWHASAQAFGLIPSDRVLAKPMHSPLKISADDLIAAVNSYRASNGLAPYSVSSILTGTAQNHANYMAANGYVAHEGPGGISVTERLLNAGYPLAGDLSLGGFRSENIISINSNATASQVINSGAWADPAHQGTMLSPNLTEIGVGVAVSGGLAYIVFDCALPTGNGQQPVFTPSVGGTPGTAPANEYIVPITISTARADGAVVHNVQSGQSLWSIAIAYGVKIDEIRALNKLGSNDIYPNQDLIVKYELTATPIPPTATITYTATQPISTNTMLPTSEIFTSTSTLMPSPQTSNNIGNGTFVVLIILVALLAGGIGVWLGVRKSEQ